jgi:tetratricopeptide (TPR) repeat protein
MVKKASQQGRSERKPEAYSSRYVEGLSDARTKLGAFFNILNPSRDQRGKIGTVGDLLVLLLVLITIGVWWTTQRNKPRATPPPPPPQPAVAAPVQPAGTPEPPPVSAPSLVAPPSFPGGQAQLFQPGLVQDAQHAAVLNAVHELIEGGRETEAEARLAALPPDALKNDQIRQAASVLWNNLGIARRQSRGAAAAIPSFKTAVAMAPGDQIPRLNLTRAYVEAKDPALTREFLEQTIQIAPDDPLAHLALSELLYDKDDLAGAMLHLEQGRQRTSPHAPERPYLDMVAARVSRAEKAEQRFSARESSHFLVKFNGNEDYDTWTKVLDILEDAYRDIGQKFSYFPGKPITVVLHTKEAFQGATGSPAWADGLYDPILGRIQIPTQGALTDLAWLARVLRHEFVHALLHQRVEGGRIPQWLNEGLAMQLAGGESWPDLDRVIRGEVTLIPLDRLEGGWTGFPSNVATVAYLEGNSATAYLIERYGMGKVQDIVQSLASHQPIGAAIKDRLFISYEEFQQRWAENINEKIRAGKT